MRASLRSFALVVAALCPAACGGTAPVAQAPTPVPSATVPVIAAEPAPDLSPVAEPPDVVGVARWRSPNESFGMVQKWFGVPVPVEQVLDNVFNSPGAASVVAMDSPVDGLVALDPGAKDNNPQPFAAFSVGIRSVNDAKKVIEQRHQTREIHPGVYGLEMGSHADVACLIAPSIGTSGGRLVCGARDRDIEALYPYMTRGLPAVKLPNADLHAELKFAPVKQKYSPMLPDALRMASSFVSHEFGTGDRRIDRAITDAMNGLSVETESFVRDLEGMNLDLVLDQNQRTIRGDFALKLRGQESWIVQRSFDHAGDSGPPPAIFWRAPKDADSVFYGRGVNSKAYDGLRASTNDLLDAVLAKKTMDAPDRKAISGLVDRLFSGSPTLISAAGHLDPPAGAKDLSPSSPEAIKTSLGWFLYGFEEGPDRAMGFLKEFAATYNKPSMQKWLREQLKVDAKLMPTLRMAPFAAKGITGAQALEIRFNVPESSATPELPGAKKAGKAKTTPMSLFLVVMPDGPRTWMAFSGDRAAIESRLLAVKAGAPDSGTIAARAGIDDLKSTRAASAGFMTMAGVVAQQSRSLSGYFSRAGHDDDKALEALARVPNHGETPILFNSTVQAGTPSTVSLQFQINKGTVDDLASLVTALSHGSNHPPVGGPIGGRPRIATPPKH